MLTLSGLLLYVLQMPREMEFGRILPAAGLMMCLSTMYYAYLAYRLARNTGRADVCALPSGISVPHMFIVTLVIMLPIKLATGDPVKAWQAGLVAIAAATLIAWGSNLVGLNFGGMNAEALKASFGSFGFAVPHPTFGLILGGLNWTFLSTILVTAIPFGIHDLVEAMDKVVSASAAWDDYPTTRVLTADGALSLIGCLMDNPYINAVYIGHPG